MGDDLLPARPLSDLTAAANRVRAALLRLAARYHLEPARFIAEAEKLIRAAEPQLAEHLRAGQLLGFFRAAKSVTAAADLDRRHDDQHADEYGRVNRYGKPTALPAADPTVYPSVTLPSIMLGADYLRKRIPFERHEFDQLDQDARQIGFTVARTAGEAAVRQIRNKLAEAVEEGQTLGEFRAATADAFDQSALSESQIETIYRTHVGRALTAGKMRVLEHPAVHDQFPYLLYSATHDSRVRPEHLDMEHYGLNGSSVYRADDPIWNEFLPPWSWNSVVGETVIQGPVLFASKARYAGQVLKLSTLGGRTLTVTANHPVLTPRGFVRADALHQGEQLLSYRRPVDSLAVVQNVDHPPARIDEVFDSFRRLSGGVPIEPVRLHLDAETERRYSDVEVVACNGQLRNDIQARRRQRGNAFLLSAADLHPSLLPSFGSTLKVFGRRLLAAVGFPHVPQIGRQAVPVDAIPARIGPAANLNLRRQQAGADGCSADPEFFRQLEFRFPGQVIRDQLVKIESHHYCGPVYDVQTTTGHMVADGIVVSNCRCEVVAIDKETAAEYGVKEAREWVETGIAPAVPEWVEHPPFRPPEGWVPTGRNLSNVKVG